MGCFPHTTTSVTTPVCHHPHGTATSTPHQYGVNRPCIRRRSESASSMSVPISPVDPRAGLAPRPQCWRDRRLWLSAELENEDCPAPESPMVGAGSTGGRFAGTAALVFQPLQSFLQLGLEPDHRLLSGLGCPCAICLTIFHLLRWVRKNCLSSGLVEGRLQRLELCCVEDCHAPLDPGHLRTCL